MIRSILFNLACLLAILGIFFPGTLFAQEIELSDWRVFVDSGYVWYHEEKGDDKSDLHGLSLAVGASWRFFDNLALKLDADLAAMKQGERFGDLKSYGVGGGLNYDLDVGPLVGTVGAGVGGLFRTQKKAPWKKDAAWHFHLSGVYYFTKEIGLGIDIRETRPFSGSDNLLSVSARLAIGF